MSVITLSAGVVSSEASLLGLQTAAFLLYVCELLVSLPVLIRIACEQLRSYCMTMCACELQLFLLLIRTACKRLPSYCMIVCLCVCILLVSLLVLVKAA